MGLVLASGTPLLELVGISSSGYRGSFLQLLTEATPVAPSLPKPGHANPIQFDTMMEAFFQMELWAMVFKCPCVQM